MKKQPLIKLFAYTARHSKALTMLVIVALLANGLALFAPYISGRAIDFIRAENDVEMNIVFWFVMALGVVYILNAVFTWATTALTAAVSNRVVESIRKDVFAKINTLPLSFFDNQPRGDILSRMTNDVDSVADGILQGMTQLLSGIVTVVGTLAIMFWLSPVITLAILVITVICIFVSKFIATRSGAMFRKQSQTVGELNGFIEEMIGNQKVVTAFGYAGRAEERFAEINSRLYDCGQKAQFYSSLVNPTTRYINSLGYISVGVIGGLFAISGGISVGIISSFLIYATQFARPINDMASILTQLQSAGASAERIFKILHEESESSDNEKAELMADKGNVVFEDVSFSYQEDKPLIRNMNINVKSGETVAIVGPTGAGKTTIVNLLMRFYDTDGGRILIDGMPIDDVTRKSLRKNFAMVLQDSWLFAGTVRDNIAYGRDGATDEEIVNAAKSAHAHSFIKRLPDGYNTMIAEDGANLSQGQRQLLTIARAMLADPAILILDEATSSVDTMTEQRIQKAFLKMMNGRTSFVIAHRLSTIREADLILVMKDGSVIEQGTHESLLELGGFYANLWNS